MKQTFKRRTVLKAGLGFSLVASQFHNIPFSNAAKIPRTHGPTTKRIIPLKTEYRPGTILISNADRILDFVLTNNRAARYNIAIGRDGFSWTGKVDVAYKREWPTWRPPAEMRKRDATLPKSVPPGPFNPLGARAIYLYEGGRDTLYRIHGTNDAASVGGFETSGCFRMTNADVLEFYENVQIGTKVVVRD